MEIQNQHILITGANRGIGRAVAKMFAENKAHLHLANRTVDPDIVEELGKAGAPSVFQYQADLGTREGVEDFLKEHGPLEIDLLFNNAGQLSAGGLEEQDLNEIYSMLQVNINALTHLTHAYLPGMLKRKKGKIINHSSVSAYMHYPASSTYAASKAYVAAFTDCLRHELKGTGVNTLLLITPGVETRMFRQIAEKYAKNFDLKFLKSMPAKEYADRIREAVLEDLDELSPAGVNGLSLLLAQHAPGLYAGLMAKFFRR